MFTVANKRQVLSIKEKILMQEIENGKKKADVMGIRLPKFYYQKD
jgi:hypothetical protein